MLRGLFLIVGIGLVLAACGEARAPDASQPSPPTATTAATTPTGTTLKQLLGLAGSAVETKDMALPGGADLPVGKPVRIPFLLLDKGGKEREVTSRSVQLYVAKDASSVVYGPFEAHREAIEATGAVLHDENVSEFWVGTITVPATGPHFLIATYETPDGPSSAQGPIQILDRESTPAVGAAAPPSDTPTLASTGGNLAALTTSPRPHEGLYEYSVRDALDAHAPFVLVFATPKFCTSRMCGPVVDIVSDVRERLRRPDVRFIHVEIYKDNDPDKGANEWVQEWGLPTEPWVFVVGADGKIATKFEGSVSRRELEAALAELAPTE